MTATFAGFWALFDAPAAATAPPPRRRSGPVLMGDILVTRGGEPELLIRWREDRDRQDGT